MPIQPYLHFNGNCEEALEFYKEALGAKVEFMMRYSETPGGADCNMVPASAANRIMHATVRIGDATIMASDHPSGEHKFESVSLSYTVNTEAEAEKAYAGLSNGAQSIMAPLGPTFFSPKFGMLTDRFGVHWMIMVPAREPMQARA